jgi:ATP-dependent DNA ligase
VIGGYTRGGRTFDAIVIGRWDGDRLVYVARTRVGFTAASRERLMAKLWPLEIPACPFANLPEARSGRWGEGLTAEKMKECVWVRPELVAEMEFVERTPDRHLRNARFVRMKEKDVREPDGAARSLVLPTAPIDENEAAPARVRALGDTCVKRRSNSD